MRQWLSRLLSRVGGTLCWWAHKLDVPVVCIDCEREHYNDPEDCPFCNEDIAREREYASIYEDGAREGYEEARREYAVDYEW